MENLRDVIAKNLIGYRTGAGLTQIELAEKINYSDKSISKWERGLAIPDVLILKQLAELYGVRIDDFFVTNEKSKNVEIKKRSSISKVLICMLSVGLVWLLATLAFVIFLWLNISRSWLCFIVAIPIGAVVLIVFATVWGRLWQSACSVSLLIWSTALSGYLIFYWTTAELLFLLCVPLQVLVILWYILMHVLKHRKRNKN